MSVSTAQTAPVVSHSGGLAQNALAGVNAVFSSAVVYVTNIVPNGKTVKQEFSELVTGLSSGDWETRVRAVLKYGRGQTANVAVMGIGAVSTYAKGGLSALGTFGAVLGGGLIGGFAGAYVGTWGGDWLAENVFHWNKTDINSDKPVCKGDIISHQRKDMALWGLALGVLAGAAILFFGAMTFGFGLLAGFVAGAIIAGAHAMSQYGEEKGEIKEGSPDVTFEGRPVARMGDRVECDDHSPEEFIAEGVKTVTVNGRLLAKVGCRTTCDGNLDRKTKTTIGVDKATATDPENYPIRESTSLLAEIAATASIYAPWERMFGKVKGAFTSKNNVEVSPAESTTNISDDMIDKILWGQRKNPNKNELIGGHSPEITDSHPNYAVEELQVNPDGTKVKKFITQFPDGNLSKIKKSTTFPEGWSDTQIIDGIKATGDTTPIGTRPRDGATLHRKTVDGVQIEVIKIGDDVVSGYPTGGTSTHLPSGFQ